MDLMTGNCNRCGKILYPNKHGFLWHVCDKRYLRKKREQRLDDAISKYEMEKMYNG